MKRDLRPPGRVATWRVCLPWGQIMYAPTAEYVDPPLWLERGAEDTVWC
eukprot:CAMPEP_0183344978 /NCGR_PEP_ID=MMETSP0164_2-20130417/10529_1 /TAXON_ID=221442 /ORGANISM="Coccolithus pelagicus ssp braarudi, Strain PLY182g" /LENGTH=48 /DNA_ID= /DNA_START= /DNA_END= /DNA_ORIENTATION=